MDEGSDFTLRGVLTGSQPISVSWLHNGEQGQFTPLCVNVCLGSNVDPKAQIQSCKNSHLVLKQVIYSLWGLI